MPKPKTGRPRGNPAWHKGMPAPNPGGRTKASFRAAKSLAAACREAANDEQIAEWLLKIAAGIDPWATVENAEERPMLLPNGPDWGQRLTALKMFLERRDGMPMQAIALKAEIEATQRLELDAGDAIDVEAFDPLAARVLEEALRSALTDESEDS